MSYPLILRLKSTRPICKNSLREKLLTAGLKACPDSVSPGLLRDYCAVFEIVADSKIPAGVDVMVKIPFRRKLLDFTLILLNLERLSGILNADLIDGDKVLVQSGENCLVPIIELYARYELTSACYAPIL